MGPDMRLGEPRLMGAEGAREIIAVLTGRRPGTEIRRSPDCARPVVRTLRLQKAELAGRSGPSATLQRHVLERTTHPARVVRPVVPWSAPGTVIVTGDAAAAAQVTLGPDAVVIVPPASGDLEAVVTAALSSGRPRHLRLLADLTQVEVGGPGWESALRLNEAWFLAARAAADRLAPGDTVAASLIGGIDAAGALHPAAGLFTGLVKALAHELPGVDVLAVVDQARDVRTAARRLEAETAHARVFPVVHQVGERRLVTALRPRDAEAGSWHLGPDSVVVAAGGSRGIGAAMLTELARTSRPRIFVIGSNPVDPATAEQDARVVEAGQADFLRARTTGPDRLSLPAARAAFQRLVRGQEVRATLAGLRRHCGDDRVTYLTCDLRDEQQVAATIAGVQAVTDGVDLVLNIAGITRSAALPAKSPSVFREVRDLKVRSYVHLKKAFAARPPRRWFNCGSASGAFGMPGDTDYSAANDFLYSAAEHAVSRGLDEFTTGWGLWGETGMGTEPFLRSRIDATATLTPMSTAEGVRHFAAELSQAHPPATAFFGDRERESVIPADYLDVDRWAGSVTVPVSLDLRRHAYLGDHRVDGVPTFPGFFVPELAARAARQLAPGRVPVCFDDLVLSTFLRVPEATGREVKVEATLVSVTAEESAVEVRVLADLVAPGGQLLRPDREHFRVTVRLRDAPLAAPRWAPWPAIGEELLTDPYCVDNPLVRLTGPFRCTEETRTHPVGARARFVLPADQASAQSWLDEFTVPALLLDGMARLHAIQQVGPGWTPLFVPRTVRRIEVFGTPTDRSIARAGGVELYATPPAADVETPGSNQAVAVDHENRVVARVHDIMGVVRGYLDQRSGRFVDPGELDGGER